MPLIKRLVKGSPLTFAEGDANLDYLENLAQNIFPFTGSAVITGSLVLTGSLIATSFTGSLSGSATSALTASFVNPLRQDVQITGSLLLSGSTNISGTINITHSSNSPTLYFTANNNGVSHFLFENLSTGGGAGTGFRFNNNEGLKTQVLLAGSASVFAPNAFIIDGVASRIEIGSRTSNVDINTVSLGTSNTRLRVFNNGNVSIGTNPPSSSYKFQVIGSGSFTNGLDVTGSFTVITGSGIEFQVTNTGVKIGSIITDTHPVTGSLNVSGSITTTGTITATTLVVQTITSSTDFVTGSTRFGSILSNTHRFTGSVSITGSLTATGVSNITASQALTASYLSGYVSPFPFTGSAAISGSLNVNGPIAATYIDAPARYDLVIHKFDGGTGSIFGNGPITNASAYNPNYTSVSSIVTNYLSYVYVDISDDTNTILHRELTFSTVNNLKVFINSINLSAGYITLYSYRNDIGSLKLGGYNHFITNATFKGKLGKVSSKRSLTKRIDTTSRGYTALKTLLTGSFIGSLSSSIDLPLLNEIITEQQINTLVNTGSISFTRMDKYNKRELSGFYVNIIGTNNPSQYYVVNSTGDNFITGSGIGSQTKLLSTSLLQYNQSTNGFSTATITTPFWQNPLKKTTTAKIFGNSFINLYIIQDIINNGRAIYIEPISIDSIVVPFSSKKYVTSTCQYFIKKGSLLSGIDQTTSRSDGDLNVITLDIDDIFTWGQLTGMHNKKSKKQIDIIRLYADKTCDVFEDGLRIEYSTYNGNSSIVGTKAAYFKLNKR